MEFVCYTDWDQLPDSADELFAQGEKDSLFFSRRWFEILSANALEDDQHLLLACVEDETDVLAILPLWTHASGHWHSLASYYTSLYTLLLADENQQEILDCMAEGLAGLGFQSLKLEPIAEDDSTMDGLQPAMASRGFECHRLQKFVNWHHPLQGQSFVQYMAERPSRLRNTIERKHRKLQREQGCQIRLFTHEPLGQALEDYNAVYRASWKGGERFTGFTPALVRAMAGAGCLRMGMLYIAGRPAAAQIWFVVQGTASIYRLVYDEAWQRYSPGSILTAYLMEQVIDSDKVESLDFLTGNERYKQDWMSESRERWGLTVMRKEEPAINKHPPGRWKDWLKGWSFRRSSPDSRR